MKQEKNSKIKQVYFFLATGARDCRRCSTLPSWRWPPHTHTHTRMRTRNGGVIIQDECRLCH